MELHVSVPDTEDFCAFFFLFCLNVHVYVLAHCYAYTILCYPRGFIHLQEWSVDDGATAGTETGRPLDVLATQFTVANASPATTEGNTTSAASASPAMTDQHDGGKKTGEDEEKQSGATAT